MKIILIASILLLMTFTSVCIAAEWYECEETSSADYIVPQDKVIADESGAGSIAVNENTANADYAQLRFEQDSSRDILSAGARDDAREASSGGVSASGGGLSFPDAEGAAAAPSEAGLP